jgi:hypothetical protein
MKRRLTGAERRALATIGKRHVSLALIEGRRIHAIELHLGKKWAGLFLAGDTMRALQDAGLVVGMTSELSGETTYHLTSRGKEAAYPRKKR